MRSKYFHFLAFFKYSYRPLFNTVRFRKCSSILLFFLKKIQCVSENAAMSHFLIQCVRVKVYVNRRNKYFGFSNFMSWCFNKCVHLSIYGLLREWMKNFHEGAHWELAENLTLTKCYSDQNDLFIANYFVPRSLTTVVYSRSK